MGSWLDAWRRFERRSLRPLVRRWRRSRQAVARVSQATAPAEQLLVALLRSEIRRAHARPDGHPSPAEILRAAVTGGRTAAPGDLEDLVRTMLAAAPASPASPARSATG